MAADTPQAGSRVARLERSGERWLAPLPMYHAYGQMYYCVNAPRMLAKVYIMPRYEISLLLLFVDFYLITFLTGVPTVLLQLSKRPKSIFNLDALEYALTGSAPLGEDISKNIEDGFLPPELKMSQGWGMTETTCSMIGFSRTTSTTANPSVDDQSWECEVPPGVLAGERWVSGRNIMKGYYKRPYATAGTIIEQDGIRWLRTGDVGYFDAEGKIFIIDRLKEFIKIKGLQVSPSELEAVICLQDGVADAAVVGVKIENGEHPRAFVVKKDLALMESAIHELMKARFAKHKWLTRGVYFVDAIPKTPSGKSLRRKLPQPKARRLKL